MYLSIYYNAIGAKVVALIVNIYYILILHTQRRTHIKYRKELSRFGKKNLSDHVTNFGLANIAIHKTLAKKKKRN